MGHLLSTIFLGDVVQYRCASIVIKVGVDIGQRDAVRVQEALKQQVILHRVNLGDAQAIGHSRSGSRSTARSHRAAQFGCHADVVLHNEEVSRETHVLDGLELKVESFALFLGEIGPAFLGSLIDQIAQVVILIVKAVGQREIG